MSFDEMMQSLKREYVQGMPSKIQQLQKACNASDVVLLREEFHKLKGTGKTYGIPEVSELCGVVEQLCVLKSPYALQDAKTAIQILDEIHATRSADKIFHLNADPRFNEIQKHLQSVAS